MLYEDLLLRFPAPRVYATPAKNYLQGEQLERACELLRRGWTLGCVAIELGYSSAPAFTLAFRRETGELPGAWKKARGIKTKRKAQSMIYRRRKTWLASDLRRHEKQLKKRRRKVNSEPKQDYI